MKKLEQSGNADCLRSACNRRRRTNHGQLEERHERGWSGRTATNELCWRDASRTPATAAPGCDGAPLRLLPHLLLQHLRHLPLPTRCKAPPHLPWPPQVTYAADAFFDFDKAVLKPAGKAKLDDLVSKVKGINLEVIIAVGHTDSVGSGRLQPEAVGASLLKL